MLAADEDVRAGRSQLIDSFRDFRVVFESGDGVDALDRLPDATVDMLLVNHRLHSLDGLATVQRIYDQMSEVPLIIVTGPFSSPNLSVEAARVGALATVTMDSGASTLIATMRRVRDYADQKELPTLVSAIAKYRQSGGALNLGQRDLASLTARQAQMISLYAQGMTDEQALVKLRIVEESQAKLLKSIFEKLKLNTRSQLVLLADQLERLKK